VRLPYCYQPNDTQRRLPEKRPSRVQLGLPEEGFVFCCFNNSYKISPAVFDSWMRILESVEDSVLWLLDMNPGTPMRDRLRSEADARGVAGERLVFAERLPHAEYLACLSVADLFLDTWPYTAHTTASDALWAGCPVLTRAGETFAGRVAGSIVRAADLEELVVDSVADYETAAMRLASEPEQLAQLRERVVRARKDSPLFDMARYTRDFESALERMTEGQRSGRPAMGFSVDLQTP
jgi:predicted O-linked N-acetylglucosamine transferase (SPINDLY family)